jgi:hypothetical protein
MKTITVGSSHYSGQTNEAIQRAVDAVQAAGGGVVEVPAGTYQMHDSLHLRSGVRVVGEPGTVLQKVPSVSAPLLDYLGYGHFEFTVTEPETFRVGMGVHIADDNSGGFYDTVATIIGRQGDLFFIDRMLNHDYLPGANGRVTSLFPIIDGWKVSDAVAENLTLDGNTEETRWLNGCRGGGVFLLGAQRVRLDNLDVRHYRGDGISFQQCTDITVRGCHVHDNAGTGLHPGSGSVRYVMEANRVHDNGSCGIYYCLRTSHSICFRNRLERNGAVGISIGERDTDHLIESNVIVGNQREGILFRKPLVHGGDRVGITDNVIGPNCLGEAEAEISIPSGLRDIALVGNTFHPGKGCAWSIAPDCERIITAWNKVVAEGKEPTEVDGVPGTATQQALENLPPIGPAALPPDGARHLHFDTLPKWTAE